MIDTPSQPNNGSGELKSFRPYTGKAPALIQIVGGLLWLGAAGLLVFGLINLLVNMLAGIIFLVLGVFFVITAKSLFSMKRSAFRNALVMAIVLVIGVLWNVLAASSKGGNQSTYFPLVYAVLLIVVAFMYRERFVN